MDNTMLISKEEYIFLKSHTKKTPKITKEIIADIPAKKKRNKYDTTLPVKYKQYLKRATDKQFEFEFSIEEFNTFIEQTCKYCGTENSNGIDRIESNKGYTKENCVPCCTYCNTMKFIYNTDRFLNHVKKIYEHNVLHINI